MQRHCNGFTLIETVIATGILVFAASAVASLFVSSILTHLINRDRSSAVVLAADKIEQLKSMRNPTDNVEYVSGFKVVWTVENGRSRTISVIIYDGEDHELMRSSTTVSPSW